MEKKFGKTVLFVLVLSFFLSTVKAYATDFGPLRFQPGFNLRGRAQAAAPADVPITLNRQEVKNLAGHLCRILANSTSEPDLTNEIRACSSQYLTCTASYCRASANDPTNSLDCITDPRDHCSVPAIVNSGLTPTDRGHESDLFSQADAKCDHLVNISGGDQCLEAKAQCQNLYLACAEAEPFGCRFDDEGKMLGCKDDGDRVSQTCETQVSPKLSTVIPQECQAGDLRNQNQNSGAPVAPLVPSNDNPIPLHGKNLAFGSGCSLNPAGGTTPLSSALIFGLSLIPLAFRRKK